MCNNSAITRKYQLPAFLNGIISQNEYDRWVHRKALAHIKRDRKRGNHTATNEGYKIAIHKAVIQSRGNDFYTGEKMNWNLISKYDNVKSKEAGRKYKKLFSLLPSLDHVGDGRGKPDFRICGWRTNDAKNDMSYSEFLELCKKVVGRAAR
jgi:hypothetical protein